jgi:hypothetical protein
MATSPTPTGNPLPPVSPAHSGVGGGGMEELLPLVLQLTNPDQVSLCMQASMPTVFFRSRGAAVPRKTVATPSRMRLKRRNIVFAEFLWIC